MGLLLGQSSSALKGLVVTPGVIDPDYTGIIKIMCFSPRGITAISPGDRIAQMLILPSLHNHFPARAMNRGDQGFGSTGTDLVCLSMGLDQRPIIALNIEDKTFQGLLDTSVDGSIIREGDWPKRWPLQLSSQTLQGLGYANTLKVSAKELTWTYEEGQKGLFQPFVLDLPISLWGRDVLSQMRIKLVTQYSDVSQQLMLQSGYVPGKGLGKGLQGTPEPIMPSMSPGRQGLGFS